MIELTQIHDQTSDQRYKPEGQLTLPIELRVRSRFRAKLDDGREAGLFLPRGTLLRGGDLLSGNDGIVIQVMSAPEKVSTVHCDDTTLLARAAYHLGNRHIPLQVEHGWLRYLHDHVLDDMLKQMGLKLVVELAPFEPEAGAYQQAANGHHHTYQHEPEHHHS